MLLAASRTSSAAGGCAIVSRARRHHRQTTLRFSILLLLVLLVLAGEFGLDVVLGAFLAGAVLRRWAPGDTHSLEGKLDAVGYGFFIPVFFVGLRHEHRRRLDHRGPGPAAHLLRPAARVRGLPGWRSTGRRSRCGSEPS